MEEISARGNLHVGRDLGAQCRFGGSITLIDLKGKVESGEQGAEALDCEAGRAKHRNLKDVFSQRSEKEVQRRRREGRVSGTETDHGRAVMEGSSERRGM